MLNREQYKWVLEQEKLKIEKKLKALEREDKLETLLETEEFQADSLDYFHPYFPIYSDIMSSLADLRKRIDAKQFTCQYSQEDNGMMRLMVASKDYDSKSRASGIKEIRDFTRRAKELIVIDPYAFGGQSDDVSTTKYIDDFEYSSRIDQASLKKLHIIFSSKHGQTGTIKEGIRRLAHVNECNYSTTDSDLIHDRIWIKDKSEAIVIGTSLGGLGTRLSFILDLPTYDLERLLEYLREQNLL